MPVRFRHLRDHHEFDAACALVADIWGLERRDAPINTEVLRAMEHSGSYIVGGFDPEGLVAISIAFWGQDTDGLLLHSHITGVATRSANQGLGVAIKRHQREWTLARGATRICWTFDPLIRRNAYFNFERLGARGIEYHEAFYGIMDDAINRGEASDRMVARWDLESGNPERRPEPRGKPARAPKGALTPDLDSRVLLRSSTTNAAGAPIVEDLENLVGETRLRVFIPHDIEAMRQNDRQLATQWRIASRAALGRAIQAGFVAVSMSADGWLGLLRANNPD